MEIQNQINNDIKIEKNNFLNTLIGKTINNAIDVGLKTVLPDFIENQVIEIKNSLLQNGLKAGIDTAVNAATDLGKSAVGIFTGNFENMTQVRNAVADGGLIETMSDLLDRIVDKTYKNGHINRSTFSMIKNGKNILLENISSNIKSQLDEQENFAKNLSRYVDNWKEYYNNKDFNGMDKEYNKIQTQSSKIVPLENLLKDIREIEVLHNLIKNNGQNFQISEIEKQLAEKLTQ